eukprot:6209086-Pleurochrysis_carterae.AAC.3
MNLRFRSTRSLALAALRATGATGHGKEDAGYYLPHSAHAHQAYAYATEHCHVTHGRHAHTVTPARAPEWLLFSRKRSHARRETCACTQSVNAQALTTACAPVHAYDSRDAQPVTPAAAFACEGTLAWDNQSADAAVHEHAHIGLLQDCVHGCDAWCASEARLQAARKIGRPCSCLRQHNRHHTTYIQTKCT